MTTAVNGEDYIGADPNANGDAGTFKVWDLRELLAEDLTINWAVRGLLIDPTYGVIGGAKKTLKSYFSSFLTLAIASGQPLFNHFKVDQARPVVVYVGEGGRKPWTRRMKRIAAASGVDLGDLWDMYHPSFEVAPIGSAKFTASVAHHLEVYTPGLLNIDPLYAFHNPATTASNLYERGAMLSSISTPCMEAEANLLIDDHFNKTGKGDSLDRITQTGMQEWADTWILLSHLVDPDVDNGIFQLKLEIGSRQWGGSTWELRMDVGRFDPEIGEFEGSITFDLDRHNPGGHTDRPGQADTLSLKDRVLATVAAMPMQLTRAQLRSTLGAGRTADGYQAIKDLEAAHKIVTVPIEREEGGKTRKRDVFIILDTSSVPGTDDTGTDQLDLL